MKQSTVVPINLYSVRNNFNTPPFNTILAYKLTSALLRLIKRTLSLVLSLLRVLKELPILPLFSNRVLQFHTSKLSHDSDDEK